MIELAIRCGLLLLFLAVATVTDIRQHKIYNKTTYPGMVVGLLVRLGQDGWPGLSDGLVGFLVCGFVMLLCFVFFNVGGGDVKLIAMMGIFLGMEQGVEALLWTFILGAMMGTVILIWQFGAWNILVNTIQHIRFVFRARSWVSLTEKEREPLQRWLFLAPSAFAAVVLVIVDAEYHFTQSFFGP